jgi:methionine-rich copper-binding protein CopC
MKTSKFLFAAGLIGISLIALPASAHTELVSADPAAESTLDSLPAKVSLTFGEELIKIGDSNLISVVDESGGELASGNPDVTGAVLSIDLNESEAIGLIQVKYRAVAADGHVITGDYHFTVSPNIVAGNDQNAPTLFVQSNGSENKISIYLIISATLVVGGGFVLFFIWKRQSN